MIVCSAGIALVVPNVATSGSVVVSKAKFGKRWPFKVKPGVLRCDGSGGVGAVTFSANGKSYALNGIAKQQGAPPVDPIWRNNPSIPGTKVDIGPMIERGLKLCK